MGLVGVVRLVGALGWLIGLTSCAARAPVPARSGTSTLATYGPEGIKLSPVPSSEGEEKAPPAPANAAADVAYYRSQSAVLAKENQADISHTDFVRLRRGRLLLGDDAHETVTGPLEQALGKAFETNDMNSVVSATTAVLAVDQANIRAHMVRAFALRKLGRKAGEDFHRAVALGLIDSIVHSGDGHSFETAWTAYRVKEEYEILKVLGAEPNEQSLMSHGNQQFDVLDARDPSSGQALRVYFNVTELLGEEARELMAP